MTSNVDISPEDVQTIRSVAGAVLDAAEEGDDVPAPEDVAVCADTDIDDTAVETVIAAKVMNQRPPEWAFRLYTIQAGGDDQ